MSEEIEEDFKTLTRYQHKSLRQKVWERNGLDPAEDRIRECWEFCEKSCPEYDPKTKRCSACDG